MPESQHPGVYVEEIEGGPRPIEGVPTSIAAILSETERGPFTPRLVSSAAEYESWFGDIQPPASYMSFAVRGFFENGGQRLVVARVAGAATADVDDYVGIPTAQRPEPQGLAALEQAPYRDVSLVYAPNAGADIAAKLIDHCERMRFRFAILDCPKDVANPSTLAPRDQIRDSSYAAFYYPWITSPNPRTGKPVLVPPGGHILGVYARVDSQRGVFKAPANEILRGALGVEFSVTQAQQASLNPRGVNVIRALPGRGILVWGARTLTSSPEWKYISVRRLFLFLERSIWEGTQWVVFEPNDDRLWTRVTETIRTFLRAQWRQGALLGRTEQEAYFIKCDRTTMTEDDIQNGRLICLIGVAPLQPAEFVLFRIFQHTA